MIGTLAVQPGQQVYEGQLLARLMLVDKLEVVAQVDEVNLKNLYVGDKVSVTLDMDESNVLTGTVTEIGNLGRACGADDEPDSAGRQRVGIHSEQQVILFPNSPAPAARALAHSHLEIV